MRNEARSRKVIGAVVMVAMAVAVPSGRQMEAGASNGASQPPPVAIRGAEWPQWAGPERTFMVDAKGLADTWPAGGPRVIWDRPLGPGHSAIVADQGRLFTMYRAGDGRAKQGPWDAEESVVALDAATGETLWRHTYPSRREDFSFGAGPHATPLVVGRRLFTFGTNKQLRAFDTATGRVLWARDLIDEGSPELLIRPVVKTGHGCSLIAWRDTIICSVGGPGQSVMAFRQSDGEVVWRSGHFLTSEAPPILIALGGRTHLVVLGGGAVHGLDPDTGAVLWSHPHDPGNDLNCGMPLWHPEERILFLSSAYKAGSRALRLTADSATTRVEELWFTNRVRFMFLNALRLGGHVYGTTGDFGPAFLTALDLETGRAAWQHRGFGRASLIHADGKTIILDEDGDLALARLSPAGAEILAEAKVFDTTSWTVPTLVGTTLFARDRERIVALDLGDPAAPRDGLRNLLLQIPPPPPAPPLPEKGTVPFSYGAQEKGTGPISVSALSGTWRLDPDRSRTHRMLRRWPGCLGGGLPRRCTFRTRPTAL